MHIVTIAHSTKSKVSAEHWPPAGSAAWCLLPNPRPSSRLVMDRSLRRGPAASDIRNVRDRSATAPCLTRMMHHREKRSKLPGGPTRTELRGHQGLRRMTAPP